MDYPTLFLKPQGRIGPAEFQTGALILIAVGFVIGVLPVISLALGFLGIIGLLLIYPWVVLWIKRLHDAGQSGWMVLAVVLVYIFVSLIVNSTISAIFVGAAADMSDVDPTDFGALMRASAEASRASIVPGAIANAVVSFGFVYVANMILKSDPAENQYGPPTTAA